MRGTKTGVLTGNERKGINFESNGSEIEKKEIEGAEAAVGMMNEIIDSGCFLFSRPGRVSPV
ncbi:hypothetical protein FEI17_21375 [Kosakonia radicincitans]|uniref:hypothetical protein n=1 Tax=Kosakonia radicincitans TaxID=283686 RepID=UPI0011EF3647|nr:hypothetical protein [Kosakonia radicincitans]QEM93027.1 hypothetical protein FEI17_21375 [Kosakonia radicincitans]